MLTSLSIPFIKKKQSFRFARAKGEDFGGHDPVSGKEPGV